MKYATRTCHECGVKNPQPQMVRREIEVVTGSSQRKTTAGQWAQLAMGDEKAAKAIRNNIISGGNKRVYKRKRQVWYCVRCADPEAHERDQRRKSEQEGRAKYRALTEQYDNVVAQLDTLITAQGEDLAAEGHTQRAYDALWAQRDNAREAYNALVEEHDAADKDARPPIYKKDQAAKRKYEQTFKATDQYKELLKKRNALAEERKQYAPKAVHTSPVKRSRGTFRKFSTWFGIVVGLLIVVALKHEPKPATDKERIQAAQAFIGVGADGQVGPQTCRALADHQPERKPRTLERAGLKRIAERCGGTF